MTRLKLTTWFKKRMLPLVMVASALGACSVPVAYYLRERLALVQQARADAARAGEVLRAELEARPLLWSYASAKLSERLAEAGLARACVRVVDADGAFARLETPSPPPDPWALWGRAAVELDGTPRATVWVAADQRPLVATALELGAVFALLAAALGIVLYLLPMRAIAEAERRIDALLGRLALTLQEEDRRRIARDLHDGVGQAITAARLELAALCARANLPPDQVARITHQLDEALDEVRRSTQLLAPPVLAELGLARALERHCAALADAAGLKVACAVEGELPPLSADVETACYRIVQEALANTARHAKATAARVRLRALPDQRISLDVEDDGSGLPAEAAAQGSGLSGIRERARLLGGEATITSQRGGGVRVAVTLPVEGATEGPWSKS